MLSDVFFIVMLSVIMLTVMAPIQESRKIEITERNLKQGRLLKAKAGYV